ncbi:hypothetical protein DES53_107295 [Roseimicrobium gellanilyticum]|uniref:LPP20 lipoprotein n=1 Tax=Roseimicrobium gellanilyticum TaxID=748857 RepID=A0A366HFX0_9BACT|nr:hypothetical protein [Roseimicrobium gellanilyticum]RBP41463.1 hypothetical protein DES53_107295 [Roseimicrobium gellanilyticum]
MNALLHPAVLVSLLLILWGGQSLAQSPNQQARGLAIVKELPSDKDEFATSFHFLSCKRFGVTTNFVLNSASPLTVENYKICAVAEFGDLTTRDLITEEDRQYLELKRNEFQELSQKYPTARGKLKPVMETVIHLQSQLDSGQVRYRGGWTSKVSFDAMVESKRKAAEKEAADYARELQDVQAREKNLASARTNLAGRWLLRDHVEYIDRLARQGIKMSGISLLPIPENIIQDALHLPIRNWKDVVLKEAKGAMGPAILCVMQPQGAYSMRLAFTIASDDEKIANADDLKGALKVLASIDNELAGWLPGAVAAALIKLDLNERNGDRDAEVTIDRDFGNRECELRVLPRSTHEDGTIYSLVCLTVH